jgi:hypothetical protein
MPERGRSGMGASGSRQEVGGWKLERPPPNPCRGDLLVIKKIRTALRVETLSFGEAAGFIPQG